MRYFIFLYVALLITYPALHTLDFFDTHTTTRVLRSLLALTTLLAMPGLALAVLTQTFTRRLFTFWPLLSLAAMWALVGLPLLLMMEIYTTGQLNEIWPLVNATAVLSVLLLIRQFSTTYTAYTRLPPWSSYNKNTVLLIGAAIHIAVVLSIVTAYYPLPDSDPYYWLREYQQFVTQKNITLLPARPLFFFLIYLFNQAAQIDAYAFLKYVLPGLSLLPLLPAWQLARTYSSKYVQLAILLLPLASPSTILYAQIAMPQAIFITIAFYIFYWLVIAARRKDPFFFYASGILAASAFFYYELSALLTVIWIIIFTSTSRQRIWKFITKQKVIVLLLALLVVSNIPLAKQPYDFVLYLGQYLNNYAQAKINWQFPATYTNVDGNAMGWGSPGGVIKYYLFYAGPAILFFIAAFLVRNSRRTVKKLLSTPAYLTITLIFLLLFGVSEILPRLSSLAFLPERAWIFTGIFSFLFFFTLIDELRPKRANTVAIISVVLVAVSISGALYINSFKKYLIPDYQLNSAAWIRQNVPSEAIIITAGHNNLLQTYAHSYIINVEEDTFCDPLYADPAKLFLKANTPRVQASLSRETVKRQQLASELQSRITSSATLNEKEIITLLKQYKKKLRQLSTPSDTHNIEQGYIYFSREHTRNPYANRPYRQTATCETPIFSQHPQNYTEVYNDQQQVVIWKIN